MCGVNVCFCFPGLELQMPKEGKSFELTKMAIEVDDSPETLQQVLGCLNAQCASRVHVIMCIVTRSRSVGRSVR